MITSFVDLFVIVGLGAGSVFCFWHAARGLRGGPLWIDASDDDDELRVHAIYANGARLLGLIYLATGVGCLFAIWRTYL